MQFGFYLGHENGCGHPRDCPHLGGAWVGHLVHIVNSSENSRLLVHRQLDAERERNSKLVAGVLRLEKALKQAQLELRLERQNKFATSKKSDCEATAPLSKQALANAVHRLVMPVGPVKHRHNTASVSMFRDQKRGQIRKGLTAFLIRLIQFLHARANPFRHLIDISRAFSEFNDRIVFFLICCDQVLAV